MLTGDEETATETVPEQGPLLAAAIKMSDNLSGVFMPVTQSVGMSAITQSADLSD